MGRTDTSTEAFVEVPGGTLRVHVLGNGRLAGKRGPQAAS
jgi:hypothetical protein